MGELAELLQGAEAGVQEVLAHLGLILLLQSIELAMVAVKIVVVRLLGHVSHHLAWGVVEVLLGLTVGSELAAVLRLVAVGRHFLGGAVLGRRVLVVGLLVVRGSVLVVGVTGGAFLVLDAVLAADILDVVIVEVQTLG